MSQVIIFSYGASEGNPGRGGWGAIIATDVHVVERGGAEMHTTNNRMEMTAAHEALSFVLQEPEAAAVVLHTDSSYVINGVTKWLAGWKAKDWITSTKSEVLNRDLWEGLDEVIEGLGERGIKVTWKYVGGHVGIAGNERVDEIASNYAVGKQVELYSGPREAYNVDVTNIEVTRARVDEKKSSKSRSKATAYSYISTIGGVIKTHATWAECEARVKGVTSARFKKALTQEEEAEIIKQFTR